MSAPRVMQTKPISSLSRPRTEAASTRLSTGEAGKLLQAALVLPNPRDNAPALSDPKVYAAFRTARLAMDPEDPVAERAAGLSPEMRARDWARGSKAFERGFPFDHGPREQEMHTNQGGEYAKPWDDLYSRPQGGWEVGYRWSEEVKDTFWMPALSKLLQDEGTVQVGFHTVNDRGAGRSADDYFGGSVWVELPKDSEAQSARAAFRKIFSTESGAVGKPPRVDLSPLADVLRKQARLEPLSGKEETALAALRRLLDAHDALFSGSSNPEHRLRRDDTKKHALVEAVLCQAHAETVRATVSKQLANLADGDLETLLSLPPLGQRLAKARRAFPTTDVWSSASAREMSPSSAEQRRHTAETYVTHIFLSDPTRMLSALESFLEKLDPMGETAPRVDAKKIIKALKKLNLESMAPAQ